MGGGRKYIVQTPAQVQYKYGHIVIIIAELRVHNVAPHSLSHPALASLLYEAQGNSHISLISLFSQHQPGSNFHYSVPIVTF